MCYALEEYRLHRIIFFKIYLELRFDTLMDGISLKKSRES